MQEFVPIDWYSNYGVNEHGDIINFDTQNVKKPSYNQQGIAYVNLRTDHGDQVSRSVALMVAKAFLDHPKYLQDTVIHLDGDKKNCRAKNLMWRSRSDAILYHQQFHRDPEWKRQISVMEWETEERFSSHRDACTKYGLVGRHLISAALNGTTVAPTDQYFVLLSSDGYIGSRS